MAREEAELLLRDANAALAALGRAKKKQKAASSAMGSNEEASPMEIDDSQSWKNWTLAQFRKHETENEKRRAVEIDEASDDKEPPRPGREGWRHHPRRGLVGGVKAWAEGSKWKVAFMLAELVTEFGVKDEAHHHLA